MIIEQVEYDESNAFVLERFNTTARNPIKEILLKLNLPDYMSILTDSKVTPTKHRRMTKPYFSSRFIANYFISGIYKVGHGESGDDDVSDDNDDVGDDNGDDNDSGDERMKFNEDENSDDDQNEDDKEEEYVRTLEYYESTDDEYEHVDEEEYEELYKDVNVRLKDVEHGEDGKGDAEKTDAGHDDVTQETTYEQVNDDEHVTLTTVHDTQKTEIPLQRLAFNLLKGTCRSHVELEYNFEECYKPITNRLEWNKPKGEKYLFNLSKPLPLIMDQGCQVVPVDYFINIIMEYLVKISKNARILELKRRYFEDYCSDIQYAVSIKEDTAYMCLHSPKTMKGTRSIH
nr:hypothetical protein [Tanacetum cinerariifolium]